MKKVLALTGCAALLISLAACQPMGCKKEEAAPAPVTTEAPAAPAPVAPEAPVAPVAK